MSPPLPLFIAASIPIARQSKKAFPERPDRRDPGSPWRKGCVRQRPDEVRVLCGSRTAGFRHLLSDTLGTDWATPIGFIRDTSSGPFDDSDRCLSLALLPYLQRTLQLEERLAVADRTQLGVGTLDTLTIAVVLVDTVMRVLHANSAASRLIEDNRCGLAPTRSASRPTSGDVAAMTTVVGERHRFHHETIEVSDDSQIKGHQQKRGAREERR